MIDIKLNTVIDLETAKDKLRISLTKLETVVEDKVTNAKMEAANNNSVKSFEELEKIKQSLDEANSELLMTGEENGILKEKVDLSEQEVANLKGIQKDIVQKVNLLIERIQKEIEKREVERE